MLFLELLDGPLGFNHVDLLAVEEDLAIVHDELWAVWRRRGLVWQVRDGLLVDAQGEAVLFEVEIDA